MPPVATARIMIRVQPRARRDELLAIRDGVLVVRVVAPALEGRANDAVRRLLAKQLDMSPSRLTIVRGERSREKVLAVDGIDQPALDALVAAAVGERS
jgi:uncharacterized protein (TIGR00251 family)